MNKALCPGRYWKRKRKKKGNLLVTSQLSEAAISVSAKERAWSNFKRKTWRTGKLKGTLKSSNIFWGLKRLCKCTGLGGHRSGKEPAYQCRRHKRHSSIAGSGRPPGGGHGSPLQHSCLEKPMDGGAWRATVHGAAKTQAGLKWLCMHTSIRVPRKDLEKAKSLLLPADWHWGPLRARGKN